MNKYEKNRILLLANFHMTEWNRLHVPDDSWANANQKQAHYDALTGLKYYGFIDDFNFKDGVKLDGKWHSKENITSYDAKMPKFKKR